MVFIPSSTTCKLQFSDSEADSRNMYSMNSSPFYIYDHSVLSEIKKSLESVLLTCWDIDVGLDTLIQETRDFVENNSNDLCNVMSNFDDDVPNASRSNADIVDAAASTTVPCTPVEISGHDLFAGIQCNSEFVTCQAPYAIGHDTQQLLSSSVSNVKAQYNVDSLAKDIKDPFLLCKI